MGIDIYLGWKGQTKAEHDAQITGFSISAGKVGYLRASYGMAEECKVLERIFPKNCWQGKKVKFDFKAGWAIVPDLLYGYLDGQVIHSDTLKDKTRVFDWVREAMAESDFEIVEPNKESDEQEAYWRKVWAKSIIGFFKLGMQKQDEGKEPTIYISY